ncbi:unnamed protein product [Rotaria sp. Silwood2]|nr:unnamed protein product [Rotaria sp. Silwood2]CAF4276783.1 unnamed protein product [Rotaria sp. Silwood2]
MIIKAKIYSFDARVTLTQVFRNNADTSVETVYCFPAKTTAGTIYLLLAHIDDQDIVEIKDVQSNYNNILHQNDDACLFERKEKLQDNFIVKVGSLSPSQECTIYITYDTKLEFLPSSNIQFIVPMIITPQYKSEKYDTYSYAQSSSYTIDFHCYVEKTDEHSQREIAKISSPSHLVNAEINEQNSYVVTFVEQNTYLDRDILINIELTEKRMDANMNIELGATTVPFYYSTITTNSVDQPFDYYCVLDFEAVCHQANSNLKKPSPDDIWEIIEFPICLLSAETNTIVDIYHSYVRPSIKTTLNELCISITGITQSIVDNSPTFDIVWKDVQQFLLKHSLISLAGHNSNCHSFTWITCGNWDLRTMLSLQLKQSGFDHPEFINGFINIKDLYMEYYPSTRIRGMKDLLKKLNLKLEGRHHSGIDDTKNITKIAQWFIENKHPLKLTWKRNG